MISQFSYKRQALLGVAILCLLIIYHFYFHSPSSDAAGDVVQWQQLVHDGVTVFSSLRFQKEEDVSVFESFSKNHIFSGNKQLYHDVKLEWTPLERKNRDQLIAVVLEQSKEVTAADFQHGLRRWLPGIGEEYALSFRSGDDVYVAQLYRKLEAPLVSLNKLPALHKQPLHIVMPLSGRVRRLRDFLAMLAPLIDQGENLQLTVVAFSEAGNGTAPVELALRDWRHSARTRLVTEPGTFSRGRALLRGAATVAAATADSDPLLFFCDVDMTLTATELEKCRLHTERGRSVYFPIVFSRYNWRLLAALQQVPPQLAKRRPNTVDAGSGQWRDYGFGMSCQYHSDFAAVSGSFLATDGWGGEDVALYRRFIQRYRVVRAFDPDLQHLYHTKRCDANLPEDQYRGCILSKIANEGSKEQLGMWALRNGGELSARGYDMMRLPWTQLPAGWAAIALSVLLALSLFGNVWQYWHRPSHR